MDIDTGLCIISILLLIYLIYININIDISNYELLDKITSHKEVKNIKTDNKNILKIESIIENYRKKRHMNKSNVLEISKNIIEGLCKGVLGGLFAGSSIAASIKSGIIYSTIAGLSTSYTLLNNKNTYMNIMKQT